MKTFAFLILSAGTAAAQSSGGPWTLRSSTLDGGGGVSTGGVWKVSGTIGQADASPRNTGGVLAVKGGFWPGTVAEPGGPALTITQISATQVRIAWPAAAAGYTLQQSTNLQAWDFTSLIPANSTGGSLTWPIPNGPRYYFRLKRNP
jgi:hypothetical protein